MRAAAFISGILLVAIGLYSFTQGTPNAQTGLVSKTALIPCWIGLAVIVGGLLGLLGKGLHKHGMHLAALAALVGAVGSTMPIRKRGFDLADVAVQGSLATIVICLVFLVLAVRSFVVARVLRKYDAAPGA